MDDGVVFVCDGVRDVGGLELVCFCGGEGGGTDIAG